MLSLGAAFAAHWRPTQNLQAADDWFGTGVCRVRGRERVVAAYLVREAHLHCLSATDKFIPGFCA